MTAFLLGPPSEAYVAIGGLPGETSVVTTTLSDGTRLWQRSFAGMAFFNSGTDLELTLDVLDETGRVILQVETWEPDSARPDGYLTMQRDES
ncbi:MAG: hypothetical protein QNJ81_13955 [Acidimicrobiia bacterium]|nr:hypothetical protein [Acidimicrobiia bacterium]